MENLGFISYGISDITLEQVFMKVIEKTHKEGTIINH